MSSSEVNLNLHQSTHFHGYKITNNGLTYKAEYNVQYVSANLGATNDSSKESVIISPTRSKFTNNEQWFNEVGVYSTFWHDVYLVLASFDIKTESVSLKMNYNPTVKFVWTSVVVALFGVFVALSHRAPRNENASKSRKSKILSAGIILLAILCLLFAYSGLARADDAVPTQMNPQFLEVAKELRCPTCLGMSIIESGTPQSLAMRTEIENQLSQGKSKKEIINYFKDRYGAWILREPDFTSSYGFLIWVIPILGFIGGPLFIVIGVKKSQKRKIAKRKLLLDEINQTIFEIRNRGDL